MSPIRSRRVCLSQLVQQQRLSFDFFGDTFEYAYSKYVANPERMRQALHELVRQAIEYYGEIPAGKRDFDQAKAEFQRQHPV